MHKDLLSVNAPEQVAAHEVPILDGAALLAPLLQSASNAAQPALVAPIHGVVVGTLLALADNGQTPLVTYTGQPGHAALPARSVVALHGPHMGREVVLMFEQGDPMRPIVMGVMQALTPWSAGERPEAVEVEADGARLQIAAKEQLVLRCGKASITLTQTGKVLIDGTYVLSKSSGVNRVKGGSVQLN